MKGTIEITDETIKNQIKKNIDTQLSKLDKVIESKVNIRIDQIIKSKMSDEKINNFVRDRISRIITNESIKEFSYGVTNEDVLSNIESKILLMIKNSKDFKTLVKSVLKNSL
jgi:uncharacterized membrane protein YheB (UPF0754 family)